MNNVDGRTRFSSEDAKDFISVADKSSVIQCGRICGNLSRVKRVRTGQSSITAGRRRKVPSAGFAVRVCSEGIVFGVGHDEHVGWVVGRQGNRFGKTHKHFVTLGAFQHNHFLERAHHRIFISVGILVLIAIYEVVVHQTSLVDFAAVVPHFFDATFSGCFKIVADGSSVIRNSDHVRRRSHCAGTRSYILFVDIKQIEAFRVHWQVFHFDVARIGIQH